MCMLKKSHTGMQSCKAQGSVLLHDACGMPRWRYTAVILVVPMLSMAARYLSPQLVKHLLRNLRVL